TTRMVAGPCPGARTGSANHGCPSVRSSTSPTLDIATAILLGPSFSERASLTRPPPCNASGAPAALGLQAGENTHPWAPLPPAGLIASAQPAARRHLAAATRPSAGGRSQVVGPSRSRSTATPAPRTSPQNG